MVLAADEVQMFEKVEMSESQKCSAKKKTVLKFKSLKKLIDFQRQSQKIKENAALGPQIKVSTPSKTKPLEILSPKNKVSNEKAS